MAIKYLPQTQGYHTRKSACGAKKIPGGMLGRERSKREGWRLLPPPRLRPSKRR